MAAVLEQPKTDPAAKYGTQVDAQIAQATSRIRTHDLAFGGLLLVAMVLVYATAMIALDKYLVLPEWVRQLSLLGFLAGFGAVAYRTIIRPLLRRINPLYAAVQVEKTIDDAKNSVVGYVEAQEKDDVHPSVRAAMSAKAAKAANQADLNRAVDHRSLIYAGGVVVAFLLVLIVLFFLFRPTQFGSLMGRTFVPFSSDPIATRTRLTLVQPSEGDLTITTGQSVTIKVEVAGKIPDPENPDRLRVLLRHNPADPNFEDVRMEKGENSREWLVRVPDYLVQNGFWYKVAGGDAQTPEYKVSVRSLPLAKDFEVTYEFPAYLRRKPEPGTSPHLEAIRGTKVTLTAKTNRTVKDGRVVFEPAGRDAVNGKLLPERPDSVRFEFTLMEPGAYRLYFTSTEGERNLDPPPFSIKVIADLAPTIVIAKPEEDDIQIPANGQLAVDGTVGDDFGIDRVWLKLRIIEPSGQAQALADVPFMGGKSFLRTSDNTWPTSLDYKDSVDFTKLLAADGKTKVELKDGMVIEYWLEAADNRTRPGPKGPEADPNIGRSKKKTVHVTPPKVEPQDKKDLDANKEQRKTDEAKNDQQQQQRLDKENRDPNAQQNPNPQPNGTEPPKKDEKQPGGMENMPPMPGMPMPGMKEPEKKDGMDTMPPKGPEGMPMPKDKGGMDPMPPMPGMPMDNMGMGGMKNPDTAPMPSDPAAKKAQEEADRVQKEIEKDNMSGGSAKSNPTPNDDQRSNPAEPKPNPMGGMPPGDDQPKPEPKPGDMMNPMGGPGESKPPGDLQKPPEASAPKPEPKQSDAKDPMNKGATPPAEGNTKNEPLGGSPGSDKPTPEPKKDMGMNPPMPNPMGGANDPKKNEDPSGGGMGKPVTPEKPKPEPGSTNPMPGMGGNDMNPDPKKPDDPASGAGKPKPMPNPDRGMDRDPASEPKPAPAPGDPKKNEDAGDAKPMKAPDSGTGKPEPKDMNPMPNGGMAEPKPAPDGMGDPTKPDAGKPAETKPDKAKPMPGMGDPKAPPKGEDKLTPDPNAKGGKPDPKDAKQPANDKGPKSPTGDPKIDSKEFEEAVKDLASPDKAKQDAARQKLDKMVGPENRKAIEGVMKDLQSGDPERQKAAQKKIGDWAKQAEQNGPKGKEPTKEEIDDLLKKANDLNSKDDTRRQAAEKAFD